MEHSLPPPRPSAEPAVPAQAGPSGGANAAAKYVTPKPNAVRPPPAARASAPSLANAADPLKRLDILATHKRTYPVLAEQPPRQPLSATEKATMLRVAKKKHYLEKYVCSAILTSEHFRSNDDDSNQSTNPTMFP